MKPRWSLLFPAVLCGVLAVAGQNPAASDTPSQNANPAAQPPAVPNAGPAARQPETPPSAPAPSANQGTGSLDSNDPLLQPPPVPPGKPSLIGGTVGKIDRIRSNMVVRPFGGKNMKIYFDERTHIYRDGVETTELGIKKGDRVYIDSLLDGPHVFAKAVRVETRGHTAEARGQLMSYDQGRGNISMRDELTAQPVTFAVGNDTVVRHGGATGSIADLQPGSLIDVRFAADQTGRPTAREITIYAAPGSSFTFAGKITHLDMKSGVLAIQNQSDNRNYEIHFAGHSGAYDNLGLGSDVTIQATFDGSRYHASSIERSQAKAE